MTEPLDFVIELFHVDAETAQFILDGKLTFPHMSWQAEKQLRDLGFTVCGGRISHPPYPPDRANHLQGEEDVR